VSQRLHGVGLTRPRPISDGRFRLFVLHHAGGSHLGYMDWVRHFPSDWDVCLVDAPGRGRSLGTEPLREAEALAHRIHDRLLPELDRPYGIFGHSMGGLLTYELADLLAAADARAPTWLGISAWSPRPESEPSEERYLCSSEELRQGLAGLGGTPDEVLYNEELWRFLEPLIRADLQVVDTWRPRSRWESPRTPLSVFGGESDTGVPPELLNGWRDRWRGPVNVRVYPGGHFYLGECPAEVAAHITEDVESILVTGHGGRTDGSDREGPAQAAHQ